MSMASITEQFEASAEAVTAGTQAETRRAALERFLALGLPGKHIETWHYTDLTRLADEDYCFVSQAPDTATVERVGALLEAYTHTEGTERHVFVDGQRIESLCVSTPGARTRDTAESAAGDSFPGKDETALAALSKAFAAEGASIHLTESPESPVELFFVGTGERLAPQQRIAISLATGCKAVVVAHFLDLGDAGDSWLNLVADIDLAASSELTLYRLQRHGHDRVQTALVRAALAEGARLTAGNIELGGKLVRNEYQIALNGEGSDANVFGLALTRDRQHCDTRIAIDHRAARTTSRQNYRAIVDDASRSVFNGKVVVREQAQHIEARQKNDNLLLSSRAEADTKPELEIYADQVVCSHGATVGELAEDHLFYLRSRGIDESTARAILTTAFAETILDEIGLDSFREVADAAVSAALPDRVAAA